MPFADDVQLSIRAADSEHVRVDGSMAFDINAWTNYGVAVVDGAAALNAWIFLIAAGAAPEPRSLRHGPIDGCGAAADDLDDLARRAQLDCLGLSP